MKNASKLAVLLLLCLPLYSWAQEDTSEIEETIISIEEGEGGDSSLVVEIGSVNVIISDDDKIKVSRKGKEAKIGREGITIKKQKEFKKFETKWGAFGLGLVNFIPDNGGPEVIEANAKSADVHWAIIRQQYNFNRNVSINWALDMNWRNYRFDQDVIFIKDPQTGIYGSYIDSNVSYSKNKLMARYIGIPVMLSIHTKESNSWKSLGIAFGAQFSQFLGGRQKLISSEFGKQKKNGNYGFSPQRIDWIGEITLGKITLYGQYGMTPMFRSVDVDYSTSYTPYSFGIKLIGL